MRSNFSEICNFLNNNDLIVGPMLIQGYPRWMLAHHAREQSHGGRRPQGGPKYIYCDRCEMWLNGPEALKKHQRRKKHSKNIAKKVLPTFVLTLTEEKEGLYGWSAGGCDILLRPADSLQDVLTAVAAQWELKGHHRVELIFGGVILRGKGNDAISKLLTKHNVPFCSTGRRSVTRTN